MTANEITQNYRGIIESTLREGRQFRWGEFTIPEQRRIVKYLRDIGVERIEVGNPIAPAIKTEIEELLKIKGRPPFLAHVRNIPADVRAAIDTGVEGVNLLTTVKPERLGDMNRGQGITLEQHIDKMRECVRLAQFHGLETRVSVEHFFSSNFAEAMRMYRGADDLGVERIGLADTIGAIYPWEVAELVAEVRKQIKAEIEVHFHDDQGHATSNALVALKAGANWINTTAAGIGERTGITPLSKILINLHQIDPALVENYSLERLTLFENFVVEITEQNKEKAGMTRGGVPFNLPTNPLNGFAHKAGIHTTAILRLGVDQYELYDPRIIGNSREFVIGTAISGRATEKDIEKI